jgi:hypothetical protein
MYASNKAICGYLNAVHIHPYDYSEASQQLLVYFRKLQRHLWPVAHDVSEWLPLMHLEMTLTSGLLRPPIAPRKLDHQRTAFNIRERHLLTRS